MEAVVAAHEAPEEGSVWTTIIHGALWEMRARRMGREAAKRELNDELLEAPESGPGQELTPEWREQLLGRCEEAHRRIEEARAAGLVGNLLLPEKLYAFVAAEIIAGRFASATEVVSEAVRRCTWHWEREDPVAGAQR